MGTTNGQVITRSNGSACHVAGQGSSGWLGRRSGLIIGAAVVTVAAAGALAEGQHWLAAAALQPLLFILPCAAMMFLCMRGMNHCGRPDTARTPSRNEAPTTTEVRT